VAGWQVTRWTAADIAALKQSGKVRNKYNAKKVAIDGYLFDSKRESVRYSALKAMLSAGLIHTLKIHPVFPIVYQETRICDVELDFAYTTCDKRFPSLQGVRVFEDVKSAGTNTPMSRLKRKLVEAFHGIRVELV
jgi:hypothetical protein